MLPNDIEITRFIAKAIQRLEPLALQWTPKGITPEGEISTPLYGYWFVDDEIKFGFSVWNHAFDGDMLRLGVGIVKHIDGNLVGDFFTWPILRVRSTDYDDFLRNLRNSHHLRAHYLYGSVYSGHRKQ